MPHTLSLITTHRCTAACDHCCFSCSPTTSASITIPKLYRYIQEATEIPTLKVIVFTGGECFLLGSELDKLVKEAADRKFVTRFVSNGYWAVNPRVARARLERLQQHGLYEANFSTGDQHAEYVKPEYVLNGAVAAADLGITTVVTFELYRQSTFPFEEFINAPEFKKHSESGLISIKLAPWMKFQGKRALGFNQKYMDEVDKARTPEVGCSTALKVLAISPRLMLFACCGLPVEDIEEMHIGSVRDATIREVLSRAPDDFVKIWIHLHGPDAVMRYAQKFDPSIRLPKQAAHICDACRYLYSNKHIGEIVKANPPPNMKEIVNVYFQSLLIPPRDLTYSDAVLFARQNESLSQIRAAHRLAVPARCQ
ncbi:MAG: radical SAM protein [Verrucomicrobiota bacterium]